MEPRDAEFTVGDWSKPHALMWRRVVGEDVATVTCACGWQCTTGAIMAKKMGDIHLVRGKSINTE